MTFPHDKRHKKFFYTRVVEKYFFIKVYIVHIFSKKYKNKQEYIYYIDYIDYIDYIQLCKDPYCSDKDYF